MSTINTQAISFAAGLRPIALPQPTPLVAQSQRNLTANEVRSQLAGQWLVKDQFFVPITVVFTPEGKLYIFQPFFGDFQNPTASELNYKINSTTQPMQIDLVDSNGSFSKNSEPLQTIFEFTTDNRMRVEFIGIKPGESRPTEFTTGAIFLEKVSQLTALPRNTTIANSPEAQSQEKQSEAKQLIGAMNRAQQAFYAEYNRFTGKIEELQIDVNSETENYRYEILLGDEKKSVVMTATAKRPDLRSYASIVFANKNETGDSRAEICETNEPSTEPLIPYVLGIIGEDDELRVECPIGSHLLGR